MVLLEYHLLLAERLSGHSYPSSSRPTGVGSGVSLALCGAWPRERLSEEAGRRGGRAALVMESPHMKQAPGVGTPQSMLLVLVQGPGVRPSSLRVKETGHAFYSVAATTRCYFTY